MSLKDKKFIENLKELRDKAAKILNNFIEKVSKLPKEKLAAAGISFALILTMGSAVLNEKNVQKLESEIVKLESKIDEYENKIQNATIKDEQTKNEVLALEERCKELQTVVENYKDIDEKISQQSEDLLKIDTLIDAAQDGKFSGEKLVNLVETLQNEVENQTKVIAGLVEELDGVKQVIKSGSVFDDVNTSASADEIETRLITNLNKISLDVECGVRTDFSEIFADLEKAEALVKKNNAFKMSEESILKIHSKIIEVQMAVVGKDFTGSMSSVINDSDYINFHWVLFDDAQEQNSNSYKVDVGYAKSEKTAFGVSQDESKNYFEICKDGMAYAGVSNGESKSYYETKWRDEVKEQIESEFKQTVDFGLYVENYEKGEFDNLDFERTDEGYSFNAVEANSTNKINIEYDLGHGVRASLDSENYVIQLNAEEMTKEEFNEKFQMASEAVEKIKIEVEQQKENQNPQLQG